MITDLYSRYLQFFKFTGICVILNLLLLCGCSKNTAVENEELFTSEINCGYTKINTENSITKYKFFDDRLYFCGYNVDNFGNEVITEVFNLKSGTIEAVDINSSMMNYCNLVLLSDESVYIECDTYRDSVFSLEKYNIMTGEKTKSIEMDYFSQAEKLYSDDDGNICLLTQRETTEETIFEVQKYTSNLDYIATVKLSDVFDTFEMRTSCKVLATENQIVFCSQNKKGVTFLDVCDKQFESVYSNICTEISGEIIQIIEDKNRDILLFSADESNGKLYVDRIDSSNGKIIEITSGLEITPLSILGSYGDYDFLYVDEISVCGYRLNDQSSEILFSFNDNYLVSSMVGDNLIFLMSRYTDINKTIYVSDLSGKVTDTYIIDEADENEIMDYFPVSDGIVYYSCDTENIYVNYINENKEESLVSIESLADVMSVFAQSTGDSYIITHSGEDCCLKKINLSGEIESSFSVKADSVLSVCSGTDDEIYIMCSKDGSLNIESIKDDKINSIKTPDLLESVLIDGNDEFSFYITDYTYLYGYKNGDYIKILDMNTLDLNVIGNMNVINSSDIICLAFETDDDYQHANIYMLNLNYDKNKKNIINIIIFGKMNERFRDEIKKYNTESEDNYLSVIRYDYNEWEKLSNDMMNGLSPDIIVSDSSDVMYGFAKKKLAFSLNDYLSSKEYGISDNVLKTCSSNEKIEYIYPLYKIGGIFKAGEDDDYDWNLQEFVYYLEESVPKFSDYSFADELTNEIIFSNLNGFIDFESMQCKFDNTEFMMYLDYLRNQNNDVSETDQEIFEFRNIGSYSDYNILIHCSKAEKRSFKKYPGILESSFIISPGFMIGIFNCSEYKNQSLNFVSRFFSNDYQNGIAEEQEWFPVTKDSLNLASEICLENSTVQYVDLNGTEIQIPPATNEIVEEVRKVIECSGNLRTDNVKINEIIKEEICNLDYVNSNELSQNIQNKILTYIYETK